MLFEIDRKTDQLKRCLSDWRPKELEVEKYLVTLTDDDVRVLSSDVFGEELLLISNQVRTRRNKRADILALDRNGNGVIVELKRDEGRLGVETQALQYLSDFSRFQGRDFIEHFSRKHPKLGDEIAGFLGDASEEDINRNSRVILIARSFDESLFSLGEWLSDKGVSFKCISYSPVEIKGRRFLSFAVAFDHSTTAVYQLRFAASAREPGYFWHNIAEPDQNWWEFLVSNSQIPACFNNSPDDQGAKLMSGYVSGDKIVAYARGYGAVGWGVIERPNSYKIIAVGSKDDALNGNCRHRIKIKWKATVPKLVDGIGAERVRTGFGIHHPIRTSVSIDPKKAEQLMSELTKTFAGH